MTAPRALCLAALACAAALLAAPSGAFNYTTSSRDASAVVVAAGNAYNAVTTATCTGAPLAEVTCTSNFVTNKLTTAQTFKLSKETDPEAKVASWGIGGGSHVTENVAVSNGEIGVGSDAVLSITWKACTCVTTKTFYTNWTVQGEKADSLNSMLTRIMVIVTYP